MHIYWAQLLMVQLRKKKFAFKLMPTTREVNDAREGSEVHCKTGGGVMSSAEQEGRAVPLVEYEGRVKFKVKLGGVATFEAV